MSALSLLADRGWVCRVVLRVRRVPQDAAPRPHDGRARERVVSPGWQGKREPRREVAETVAAIPKGGVVSDRPGPFGRFRELTEVRGLDADTANGIVSGDSREGGHFSYYDHQLEPWYDCPGHPSGRRMVGAATFYAWEAYPDSEDQRLLFDGGWRAARDLWPLSMQDGEERRRGWQKYAEMFPHRVRDDDPWGSADG